MNCDIPNMLAHNFLALLTLRINSGASWTLFCAVYFAKNRPACGVKFDAFVYAQHGHELMR